MIAFIDEDGAVQGVEPICKVLPIAPSTYHAHAATRADPAQGCADARLADSINGLYKTEVISRRGPWRLQKAPLSSQP